MKNLKEFIVESSNYNIKEVSDEVKNFLKDNEYKGSFDVYKIQQYFADELELDPYVFVSRSKNGHRNTYEAHVIDLTDDYKYLGKEELTIDSKNSQTQEDALYIAIESAFSYYRKYWKF